MIRRLLAFLWITLFLATSPAFALTQAQRIAIFSGCPLNSNVYANFATGQYCGGTLNSLFSISRASTETSLLPTSAAGASYLTFPANQFAIVPGLGLQIYQNSTNVLLNSGTPTTQTVTLGTGSWTLWVNGSGSATPTAVTATISGAGTATNGSPNTFNVSAGGTVAITVSGSLNVFQLENQLTGTAYIPTTGVTATRAADIIHSAGPLSIAPLIGTILIKYIPQAESNLSRANLLVVVTDGGTNRFVMRSGGILTPAFASGSITISAGAASVLGSLTKVGITFSSTYNAISMNGLSDVVASSGTPWTGQSAPYTLGDGGLYALNSTISLFTYYNKQNYHLSGITQ